DAADRAKVIPEAMEKLGGTIDILVNNAAANGPHSLVDYTLERRHALYEINLNAPIDLIQGVLPGMLDKGEGWIVNISSGTARIVNSIQLLDELKRPVMELDGRGECPYGYKRRP